MSLMLKLKYSLNNQNPESLTCENNRLPAPTERTIRLGLIPPRATMGAMMLAAVSPATVADPTQTRITAAVSHPRIKG